MGIFDEPIKAIEKWIEEKEETVLGVLQKGVLSVTSISILMSFMAPKVIRPAIPFLSLAPLAVDATRRLMLQQSAMIFTVSMVTSLLIYAYQ